LQQAGGPTDPANREDIYIIRANGWKNVLTAAQFVSSMALAAAAVHSF